MFLYLSDVEAGGETIFPEAGDSEFRRGKSCGLEGAARHSRSNACTRAEEAPMVANCAERAPGLLVISTTNKMMMAY